MGQTIFGAAEGDSLLSDRVGEGGGYQIYGLARQIYQSLVHILVGARFERFEAYEPPSCLGVVNCNTHLNLNNGYMTKL